MKRLVFFVFFLTIGLGNSESLFQIKEITNNKLVVSFNLKEYDALNL